MSETEAILVLCTAPDDVVAARLGRGLVEARLAACVNVVPGLRSLYSWQGEVHDEPEVQLLIKTRAARWGEVEAWIVEHHPYDTPEVVALPLVRGSAPYLAWIDAQTSETP